ncbi:MAG: UV DNA damage repair endonuclease UvsE [Candidatus Pacearchaeota archaeon]
MKIGYPCINNSLECSPNRTFRLDSYSQDLQKNKIRENLECLKKILDFNKEKNLLYLRIGSGIVPFASHPISKLDWKKKFKKELKEIGDFIKKNNFRITMHPDQFVVLNSLNKKIVENSIKEIEYHVDFLDSLGLDESAKVQIHVGGVYENKEESIKRFVKVYEKLDEKIKKRLVIENDDKNYSFKNCFEIYKETEIPIIFDYFHFQCLNDGEKIEDVLKNFVSTWKKKDGLPLIDYSSQEPNERIGKHAKTIDEKDFSNFIEILKKEKIDADIMLEIKDKEKSALKALRILDEI